MSSPEERRPGERWGSWVRYCQTAALISVALRCISALAPDHPQQSQGFWGGLIPPLLSRASCWFCLLSPGCSHQIPSFPARNSGVFCCIFLMFQKGNRGRERGDPPKITQQVHVRGGRTLVSPSLPGWYSALGRHPACSL